NGQAKEAEWNKLVEAYKEAYPELGAQLEDAIAGKLDGNYADDLPEYTPGEDNLATRVASSNTIQALSKTVPSLFGGSADLASSNNTMMKEENDVTKDNYSGRNIWFGVREFAMAAALNGMAL